MNYELSPCFTCSRVRDPANCENKNCKDWSQWFLQSWDDTRNLPSLQKHMKQGKICTTNIGGFDYPHPDKVREYLHKNPCVGCVYPKALCHTPCPAKLSWLELKNEVSG